MDGSLLDTALDFTVLPGYTSIGYRIRERSWNALPAGSMDGKLVLVSGATSGIGLAAAEGFASLGASIRLLARSEQRGERARKRITAQTGNRDVRVGRCDLSELESVRDFVAGFRVEESQLDVLVNDAGAMPPKRALSSEGVELTFATNVLGPFLLTSLLAPLLASSAPSRVLNVSSGGMYFQRLNVDDLQSERGSFRAPSAYAHSKRAQVVLSELWAQRLVGSGIVVHAMHPGWVDTPGLRSSLPRFHRLVGPLLRTPAQGADTILWLGAAEASAHTTGRFWHDRRVRATHRVPWTRESAADRARLWSECERLSAPHERGAPPLAR
jgi:dehydrogenase/reductase SDR family protein 12